MEPAVVRTRFDSAAETMKMTRAYWLSSDIQKFWAGTSFYKPDEGNKFSYRLAEIVVRLLKDDSKGLANFIQDADPSDGGQDAALKHLDCDLEKTLSIFLGEGNWRPNRKRIAELWKERYPAEGNLTHATSCR